MGEAAGQTIDRGNGIDNEWRAFIGIRDIASNVRHRDERNIVAVHQIGFEDLGQVQGPVPRCRIDNGGIALAVNRYRHLCARIGRPGEGGSRIPGNAILGAHAGVIGLVLNQAAGGVGFHRLCIDEKRSALTGIALIASKIDKRHASDMLTVLEHCVDLDRPVSGLVNNAFIGRAVAVHFDPHHCPGLGRATEQGRGVVG